MFKCKIWKYVVASFPLIFLGSAATITSESEAKSESACTHHLLPGTFAS